jgi:hypothetical protein
LLERAPPARMNVRCGEGALGRRHRGDRLRQRSLPAIAALEDVRLVEVDVGLDQARGREPAVELFLRSVGDDRGGDLGDATAGDADVEEALLVGQPALTQDEVERHGAPLYCAASERPR